MLQIEWQGIDALSRALDRLRQQALPALALALQQEARSILEASQQLVPVDTGALRASGVTEGPEMDGSTVTMTIRYGDHGRLAYAAAQEFRTDYQHPHGQSHYLSQATFEAVGGMAQRLADHIEGRIRL